MAFLLDVNALIALVDADHVSHAAMRSWFMARHTKRWATCPLTENGMVRVLSQPAYPSGQRTPAEAVQVLTSLKAAFEESYEFWSDDISLTDASLFRSEMIGGPRQVTDAYLLGLVLQRKGALVSFDASLPWHVIKNGSSQLIEHPG